MSARRNSGASRRNLSAASEVRTQVLQLDDDVSAAVSAAAIPCVCIERSNTGPGNADRPEQWTRIVCLDDFQIPVDGDEDLDLGCTVSRYDGARGRTGRMIPGGGVFEAHAASCQRQLTTSAALSSRSAGFKRGRDYGDGTERGLGDEQRVPSAFRQLHRNMLAVLLRGSTPQCVAGETADLELPTYCVPRWWPGGPAAFVSDALRHAISADEAVRGEVRSIDEREQVSESSQPWLQSFSCWPFATNEPPRSGRRGTGRSNVAARASTITCPTRYCVQDRDDIEFCTSHGIRVAVLEDVLTLLEHYLARAVVREVRANGVTLPIDVEVAGDHGVVLDDKSQGERSGGAALTCCVCLGRCDGAEEEREGVLVRCGEQRQGSDPDVVIQPHCGGAGVAHRACLMRCGVLRQDGGEHGGSPDSTPLSWSCGICSMETASGGGRRSVSVSQSQSQERGGGSLSQQRRDGSKEPSLTHRVCYLCGLDSDGAFAGDQGTEVCKAMLDSFVDASAVATAGGESHHHERHQPVVSSPFPPLDAMVPPHAKSAWQKRHGGQNRPNTMKPRQYGKLGFVRGVPVYGDVGGSGNVSQDVDIHLCCYEAAQQLAPRRGFCRALHNERWLVCRRCFWAAPNDSHAACCFEIADGDEKIDDCSEMGTITYHASCRRLEMASSTAGIYDTADQGTSSVADGRLLSSTMIRDLCSEAMSAVRVVLGHTNRTRASSVPLEKIERFWMKARKQAVECAIDFRDDIVGCDCSAECSIIHPCLFEPRSHFGHGSAETDAAPGKQHNTKNIPGESIRTSQDGNSSTQASTTTVGGAVPTWQYDPIVLAAPHISLIPSLQYELNVALVTPEYCTRQLRHLETLHTARAREKKTRLLRAVPRIVAARQEFESIGLPSDMTVGGRKPAEGVVAHHHNIEAYLNLHPEGKH